jgi:hypothetical protein
MNTQKTLGQKRVMAEFNPAKNGVVDQIKNKTAELIDLLEALKNDEVSKTYEESPTQLQATSGEKLRVIALAQTKYETACMYAVKSNFVN